MEHPDIDFIYSDHLRADIVELVPTKSGVIGSLGCGQARTEGSLVERGFEVHGVDVSERSIEVAKTRITSARVITGDELMPFAENSLDGLLLLDVLEHIPLAWERLKHYVKMVKKGGWIIISVPNMRNIDTLRELLIKGDWPEKAAGTFDKTHIQVMTHKRVKRWGTQAGLKFVKWHDTYRARFGPHYTYKVLNLATCRIFRSFFTNQVIVVFTREE